MRPISDLLRFVILVFGLGLIFAWLGVYNTGYLPFHKSLIFWTTTMAVGAGGAWFITPLIWGERFDTWPAALKIFCVAALVSLPVTITLFLFTEFPSDWRVWLIQYGAVLVISLIVTVLMFFIEKYQEVSSAARETETDPIEGFLQRLPVKYRTATLYAISSEDHYLRVYTDLGEELILMRLADAVRDLNGADGLQVHRSWWIARVGIKDELRRDGRRFLILPTGTEVPISRRYQAEAKSAGLIS